MANRVAGEIVAHCTSCGMDLNHVICAIDGDRIVRVLCMTCKKEHAYRRPKEGGVSSAKRKPPKASPRKTGSAPFEWEKAMEGCKALPGKTYTLDGSFEVGDRVDHGTFGTGLVRKLIGPKKMEVLFKEGIKIMVRGSSG
jgi:hypothetical protein